MVTNIEIIVNSSIIVSFDVALLIVKNHASLDNLDYEHSGHTGFASSAEVAGKANRSELFDGNILKEAIIPIKFYNVMEFQKQVSGSSFMTDTLATETGSIVWCAANKSICGDAYYRKFLVNNDGTQAGVTTIDPRLGILYVGKTDNNIFKWSGSNLLEVSKSISLGETSTTAYAGNKGKANAEAIALLQANKAEAVVIETGALIKKLYSDLSPYKLIFCYGYRDALNAPNQFMFAFMPDQLSVDGEDLQFLTMAGSTNWQYPIKVKRSSDGYVYWWSAYDYGGNTTFFVTKIVGIK